MDLIVHEAGNFIEEGHASGGVWTRSCQLVVPVSQM